jgi:K+-transporting ATPase ATPase A chain
MHSWLSILFLVVAFIVLVPLIGSLIVAVFEGRTTLLHPFLSWLERGVYRYCRIRDDLEMDWKTYAKAMILTTLLGIAFVFVIQEIQLFLPFNPQQLPGVSWPLALNTAVSFGTNTNWQSYAGETTLSYATQMWALTSQNFLSAAIGLSVLMALMRGFIRKATNEIGNFWVDITRTIVYILLPISFIFAIVLVGQGTIQNLLPYKTVTGLEGHEQVIPLGPVASQEAIKLIGTNGGGYFGANSAHPFENPTQLTNLLGIIALLLIPAASVYAYGVIIGSKKHGYLLLGVMSMLLLIGLGIALLAETRVNPILQATPLLEGKEVRFEVFSSVLWGVSTTATANGSANAVLDSFSPLAGGVALFNIMLGELIFGGVGVGLGSMLMFVLLTVFLSGLMVGRTPEYLGKKIELREIQWVTLAVLAPCVLILIGSSLALVHGGVVESLINKGPHGLTEVVYAFSSAALNNGSGFSGFNANTNFLNILLSIVMLLGRLAITVPCVALAGSLAAKKSFPDTAGTFSTNTPLFAILLIGIIILVGALTFFSVLALGPIVEHLLMIRSQ